MASRGGGLSKFSVTQTAAKEVPAEEGSKGKDAQAAGVDRGKYERVAVAVRLKKEDWIKAHEFALREGTSLQKLLERGLSDLMVRKGLPPLV